MDRDELYQKVLTKVIMFLGYKPRTRKEIAVRLGRYLKSQKGLDDELKKDLTSRVLDYLVQNKLIDDQEYIKLFIESKTRGKSVLGKKVIQNRLMAKGISKEDATYFVDAAVSEEDELNSAVRALVAKYKSVVFGRSTPSSKDTRDHMGRFLLSRGFSYSTAKQAVDYLVKQP